MLLVDHRWQGNHGIARFSREVIARLGLDYVKLESDLPPYSPLDVVNSKRISLAKDDVVYSPGYNAGFTKARQLLTIHDLIHLRDAGEASRIKALYYQTIVRPAILKAGIALTVSEVSRQIILDWLQNGSVEVINVGNGCSAAFSNQESSTLPEPNSFVLVGNAKPHKNVEVVFRALALRRHYRLTVIASDYEVMMSKASEYGVESQLKIASGLSDQHLARVYRQSAGLLMPSTLEGFGLPALEALMCGTRVIHWGGCVSVDEIVDGMGVATSSAHDAEEWAVSMDAISASSQCGQVTPTKQWVERYSWDRVGSMVETQIGRLL